MPTVRFRCPACKKMHKVDIPEDMLPCKVEAFEEGELYVPIEAASVELSDSPFNKENA